MGALTKLAFGDTQVITMTTEMTEANFSRKLKSYEAQIVAAFLPKCTYVPEYPLLALADIPSDNRALASLHVGENHIPEKKMREIMAVAMHMDNMKILCEIPFKDKTVTDLDVSGKKLGTEGALVVAEYLDGAMTNLDMSDNDFFATEAGKALGDMLAVNTVLKELDLSNCNMRIESTKAFAVGIRDNGAMTSLNLANNELCGPSYAHDVSGNNKSINVYSLVLRLVCYVILCSFDLFRRDRSCQRPP
jgi:hypothetical protein